MSAQDIFIPQKTRINNPKNTFRWKFGDNPQTEADYSRFFHNVYMPTGEESWVFSGSVNEPDSPDYFQFLMSIPDIGEPPKDKEFTLENGLSFRHVHSIGAPPGFIGYRTVNADSAELIITIDLVKGAAQGKFNAHFKSHGYRIQPAGSFTLYLST
ncbi:hypothetical protein PSH66_21615 [Pseudomonas sp. FP597]|uniref:hypothetical protein n=1 Tax=Pseudomonas sp. FP597 TaxID=2954096 RepID=UPI002733B350|nr:hypothetical protein [Pseudomonas sp. FP597]WLI05179.1 hypothetical protein PSH66_21615 [Pseudomonas sp. FP597]